MDKYLKIGVTGASGNSLGGYLSPEIRLNNPRWNSDEARARAKEAAVNLVDLVFDGMVAQENAAAMLMNGECDGSLVKV